MTSFPRTFPTAIATFLLGGLFTASVMGQFDEMVKHIPGQANVLVMVNAEKLFASEAATSGNWAAERGKRFDSGLTCIPAKATKVVIGSQVDLETMHPMWDAAVVAFATAPSLADVSQHFGGIDDAIAGHPLLRVADDSYVARFSDQLLGAFGPGNRQLVASWLQQQGAALSPYFQEALRYEDAGTEIIMAIDATNALTPALVEQHLAASTNPELKNATISPDEIARIVSSLKGLMLGITFGKQPYAKIKVDFAQDATPLTAIAKPLVLAALANHGAMLDEMAQWTAEVKGTQIFFGGHLAESGLLRIASMINLPTHALHAPVAAADSSQSNNSTATSSAPADPQQLVQETTQQYFKSIDRLLADLKSRKGEERTIGQIGVWFQNYANRVDRLPILHVDQEMLQYGQYVAQQLRNASMAIKGFGITKHVAEVNADSNAAPLGGVIGDSASAYYSSGAYNGGYYGRPLGLNAAYGWAQRQGPGGAAYWAGRSEMRQASAARAQVDSQLKAGMATSVQGILEQLREAHEKVRTDMTQKYQVEF